MHFGFDMYVICSWHEKSWTSQPWWWNRVLLQKKSTTLCIWCVYSHEHTHTQVVKAGMSCPRLLKIAFTQTHNMLWTFLEELSYTNARLHTWIMFFSSLNTSSLCFLADKQHLANCVDFISHMRNVALKMAINMLIGNVTVSFCMQTEPPAVQRQFNFSYIFITWRQKHCLRQSTHYNYTAPH